MENLALTVLKPESCATCSGSCCRAFDINKISRADAARLSEAIGDERTEKLISWDPASEYGNIVRKVSQQPSGEIGMSCPLFVDNQCSVYDHRPDTCRDFVMGAPRCEEIKELR